jgi:hypothetical protein
LVGVRPSRSVANETTGVRTFDFHSVDLNAYLYKEKRTLAAMAAALGNASGARHWTAQACLDEGTSSLYPPNSRLCGESL